MRIRTVMATTEQSVLLDVPLDTKDPQALAYIAGLIDGEGHLGIMYTQSARGKNYICLVIVRMTDRVAIDFLVEHLGGRISFQSSNTKNHKGIFQWRIYGVRAYRFIQYIRPWLKVKAPQADIIIDFHQRYSLPKIGRNKPQIAKQVGREAIIKLRVLGNTENEKCIKE